MLQIRNDQTGAQSDYSRDSLGKMARALARFAPDSDGKLRGWYLRVIGDRVQLVADYLTGDGAARSITSGL